MKKILAALLAALMIISLLPTTALAAEVTATLSFASTDQRVSQDSNSQVWENDGITFTNNKAASTTPVANYSNPVRLYANSDVIIEYPGMTKIEITASSSSYASDLAKSTFNGGTTSTSGSVVTVTFANPTDSLTITKLNGQVRLKSLTVTAVESDTEEKCQHTNTVENDDAVAATCTTEGKTASVSCVDCGEIVVRQTTIAALGHAWTEDSCSRCGAELVVYDLVKDISEITVGSQVVIVAAESEVALSTTQAGNNRPQTTIEKDGNQVILNENVQVLTIGQGTISNTFSFSTGEGYLYAADTTGSQNYLRTKDVLDATGSFTVEIDTNGVATVKAQGDVARNWLRYNSGNKIFSCYASGQADIAIYKLAGTGSEPVECEHTNTQEQNDGKAATCTETGLTNSVKCLDCGETVTEQEEIAATGHAWGEGEVTTEPDCENEGVKTYTCSNCGETKTEAVEATGHEFGEEVYNEETKKFEKVCGVCDKIESREPAGITITEQPVSATAEVGATQVFSVAAAGEGQLTYLWKYHREGMEENQWYYWSEPSTTKTSINVKATADRQGYQFKCIITDAYGNTVETESVTLTVNTDDAIVINTQPAAQDKTAGETAVFSVTATGEDLTYLWQYRREADGAWYYWSNPSKDATSIEVGATVARNGYEFRCVITDANGVEKITEEVTLTVNAKELTTTVNANGAAIGETFSMDAAVSEAGEYTYLWKYQRPTMRGSDKWYYWAQPSTESAMSGTATASRIGYRFKCVIYDAYGNETVTGIYELKADGSLELVP